jgi:hypothetical protein
MTGSFVISEQGAQGGDLTILSAGPFIQRITGSI